MSYKTIVVHVDQSKHAPARIRLAATIACAHEAHLVGVAMTGISRFIYPDGAFALASMFDQLRAAANRDLDQFEDIVSKFGVHSYERRLSEDDAGGGLALQARYADLVVVSQTDRRELGDGSANDIAEYVMLNSARAVLTVPYAGHFEGLARNILIAWDGSMEATRAISNALPLLKRAQQVNVVLFNVSGLSTVHGQEPGADIALYLARHGVKVTISSQFTDVDIGNALLSLAADQGTDLLVMGGYGHTRLREVLLGGVTLTILKTMTLPVLMSH